MLHNRWHYHVLRGTRLLGACYSLLPSKLLSITLQFSNFLILQLRSMKMYILDMAHAGGDGKKRKMYLLLSITIVQALIIYLLTRSAASIFSLLKSCHCSSVTSYMPGSYDIAQMALNKMGAKRAHVPMTADGEVDYEALLAMP